MVFQPEIRTVALSPDTPVCSYHTFSPLPHNAWRLFSSATYTLADIFLLGSSVPYVARTFLCGHATATERPADYFDKITMVAPKPYSLNEAS